MKKFCLIVAASVASFATAPGASMAQFWPGNPYSYSGGAYLGFPNSSMRQVVSQERMAGQAVTAERNLAIGSSIRQTMTSQAQARTNLIQDQRQDYRDWWLNIQQQQFAQQRAAGPGTVVAGAGGVAAPIASGGLDMAEARAAAVPEIIKWPELLERSAFATRRARIEAPYRRSPPGLSVPTPDDYRNMANTAVEMKQILEQLLQGGLETQQYNQALEFLNQIQRESIERSQQRGAAPQT